MAIHKYGFQDVRSRTKNLERKQLDENELIVDSLNEMLFYHDENDDL